MTENLHQQLLYLLVCYLTTTVKSVEVDLQSESKIPLQFMSVTVYIK